MGICPEEMQRWGRVSIFKESARLLYKHYRLFLPFFLAFDLLVSIFSLFQTLFLSPSFSPLLDDSIVDGSFNTAQLTNPPGGSLSATIFSWTLSFLIYVVGTLGIGAVFYITAYLYKPSDTDDDRSIVPKIFKLLPGAFLRMFITRLWIFLALFVLCLLFFILGGILYAITYAAGWSDLNALFIFLLVLFLFLAATIYLTIVFALAQTIAVLEPGNYGRKALKRSTKLVRIGRVWTIVAVAVSVRLLSLVWVTSTNGVMYSEGMPVWAKVVLGVVIGGVNSVLTVYVEVVMVVMYFVYKARFDAAAGSVTIPVYKAIDSAEHPYEPIAEGKGSVTYLGEP